MFLCSNCCDDILVRSSEDYSDSKVGLKLAGIVTYSKRLYNTTSLGKNDVSGRRNANTHISILPLYFRVINKQYFLKTQPQSVVRNLARVAKNNMGEREIVLTFFFPCSFTLDDDRVLSALYECVEEGSWAGFSAKDSDSPADWLSGISSGNSRRRDCIISSRSIRHSKSG